MSRPKGSGASVFVSCAFAVVVSASEDTVEPDTVPDEEDVVEAEAEAAAAASTTTTTDKGKGKARDTTEEDQDAAVRRALDGITDEITAEGREADDRFQELWNAMKHSSAGDQAEVQHDLAKWEEELNKQSEGVGYRHPGGGIAGGDGGLLETAGWDGTEDHLLDGFGTIGPNGYPRLGTYNRSAQNIYQYSHVHVGLRTPEIRA